jgi:hypothetical protein
MCNCTSEVRCFASPRNDVEGPPFQRLLGSIHLSAVIPGYAGGAGPESITTIGSMDSGLALRAPRNDVGRRRGSKFPIQLSNSERMRVRDLAADIGFCLKGATNGLMLQQKTSPIANIDRHGASLLCKFRSLKEIHQRPFCSHI